MTSFEEGPLLFNKYMRHAALLKHHETLYVFWTRVGDAPERILLSTIDISKDWFEWSESEAVEVLEHQLVANARASTQSLNESLLREQS